jgi:hypothetical protein
VGKATKAGQWQRKGSRRQAGAKITEAANETGGGLMNME